MDSPLHELTLEVTQSDSWIEARTHRSSVKTIDTIVDLTNKTDGSMIEQSRSLPMQGPYSMSVQWDDGLYDVLSFFRKPTY